MSGIAGIIRFDGAPVERGLVEKMTAALNYRGPDGINHWVNGSVALGQCMLRTTPESLEETQPLVNEDQSLVLVMDGRVDNWEELRRELLGRGAVLRNRSDTELVLRAYEFWGRDCLAHIDGDFALVIWDVRRQEAFCARDRMGNKPFYYHWSGNTFAFASELHPILALPWVKPIPNEGLLAELLAAEWYSRDETLWNGILRLVAAHRMEVGGRGPRIEPYWEPNLWATPGYTRDEEYFEHYRELLTDSVRRLSRSHRPVACEVSGGLDSSAVFCLAEHLRRADRLPAPGVQGYTLAFTDDSAANEIAYARAVGEYLGVPVREIPPSILPLAWFEERARVYRELPAYPNGSMHVGLLQNAASQECRVLLTGHGGDDWAQGSRLYYAEELAQRHWPELIDCFRSDVEAGGFTQAMQWFMRYGCFPLLPATIQEALRKLVRRARGSDSREYRYWLSPRMRHLAVLRRELPRPWNEWQLRGANQRVLLQTLYDAFAINATELQERECARAGIDIRNPLYTTKFVQFAFSTPERLRLRGDRFKHIHVQALQGLMPSVVLERKDKAEFSSVYRLQLDKMKALLTATLPKGRAEWLEPEGMARLFQVYESGADSGLTVTVLWSVFAADTVLK